jgi:hypothetical protein
MYKITYYPQTTDILNIIRLFDYALIPTNEKNVDYQEYLKWVEEGNVAEEWNPGGIE